MTLPQLPICYVDGSVDFAISVPLWFRDRAKDLLYRIHAAGQLNACTEGWIKDVCKEVIVSNRRAPGLDWERMSAETRVALFFTNTEGSLFDLIHRNDVYAVPAEHMVSTRNPVDPSELPIANVISMLLTDAKLCACYSELMELDSGTLFSSIYHLWLRHEPPEDRAARRSVEEMQTEKYLQSREGQEIEAIYQARVNAAKARTQNRHG